jgi:hypothetical protein
MSSTPVRILDSVLRKTSTGGNLVEPLRLYCKTHRDVDVDTLPRVTLGHPLLDNRLIQHFMNGKIRLEELLTSKPKTLIYPDFKPPFHVPRVSKVKISYEL